MNSVHLSRIFVFSTYLNVNSFYMNWNCVNYLSTNSYERSSTIIVMGDMGNMIDIQRVTVPFFTTSFLLDR